MKKNYLFLLFTLFTFPLLFAQFTVVQADGTPINDGDVFTFHGAGEEEDLSFEVTNNSAGDADITLEYISMVNTDGSGDWLCIYGSCYLPSLVNVGDKWTKTFTSGESTTGLGDHFYNTDTGDGASIIDYVFRFYDDLGSDAVTFTYRYDPNISVEDYPEINFNMYPSLASDFIHLTVDESIKASIYDIRGNLIQTCAVNQGENQIDVKNLSPQVYLLFIESENNKRAVARFIKK